MTATPQSAASPFQVINGSVYFNGQCDACRRHCAAICCRGYGFVSLTEEEVASGFYTYRSLADDCQCDTCKRARAQGIKYWLPKQPDGSCIYLDGERCCSIYERRPETCRRYSCVGVPFPLTVG
jgi:Fe-S-cluster containining protein